MKKLTSFKIDPDTRDLVFDNRRRLCMIEGLEARKQRIRLRLGTHTQEWFLDTLLGVPWMELVEKGTPKERIRAEVTKALLKDDEVERVEELVIGTLGPDRTLPVEFTVKLRSGEWLADQVEVAL